MKNDIEVQLVGHMKAFLLKITPYTPLTIPLTTEVQEAPDAVPQTPGAYVAILKWNTDFSGNGGWWELWEGAKHRSLITAADALALAPYVGAFRKAALEKQKAHEVVLKGYEAAIREFEKVPSAE